MCGVMTFLVIAPETEMYNLDEIFDRTRSNSMKWAQARKWLTAEQCAADPLPMRVADMDFRVALAILEALRG